MSVLLLDGFDQHAASGSDGGNLGRRWTGLSSYNQGSSTPFSTGLSLASGSGVGYRAFANTGTLVLGFWFYPWSLSSGSTVDTIAYLADGSSAQVILGFHTSGTLGVYRGTTSTPLGNSSGAVLRDQTWQRVEMKVVFHGSAGSVEVRVNGTTVINLTGQNTLATANAYANRVYIDLTVVGLQTFFDDLYLLDTNAPDPTDFLTDWRVRTLQPSAAGSSAQWTGQPAGDNWNRVNDVPPSTDAIYTQTSTSGHVDLHALADPSGAVKGIKALAVNVQAKDTVGDPTSIRTVIRSGGVTETGADQALTASYVSHATIHHTDPATSLTAQLGVQESNNSADTSPSGFLSVTPWVVPHAMTLTTVKFYSASTAGTSQVRAAVYASGGAMGPGALLGSSGTTTGVTTGVNSLTLSSPVDLTEGQVVWLGILTGTANYSLGRSSSGIIALSRYWSRTFASGPDSPAPSSPNSIPTRYNIWGEGTATVTPGDPWTHYGIQALEAGYEAR